MMIARIELNNTTFAIDLAKPLDIAIPMHAKGPRAWYADPMRIAPVINQYFTGSVALAGNVNFNDIFFNPHAHGTHTETVGHISNELVSIEKGLTRYWWLAQVISVKPARAAADSAGIKTGDSIVTLTQLQDAIGSDISEAIILRTLPNSTDKLHTNYSNTNFTFLEPQAARWLAQQGVQHLLVDMPSIDREEDQGKLLAHHAFWNYPSDPRMEATITEMVFVADSIADGLYLLNLQVASFRNDAAPSRPVLYKPSSL